jgi:diguanylate cyclase (GGDEF)-like protein/PAS domain S-box-containing protein
MERPTVWMTLWRRFRRPILGRRRENTRTAAEPSYATLFNNIPIGLYVTAPDGRLIDANVELVRMLAYSDKTTLLTRSAGDFYIRPQDRLDELELLARNGGVRRFETLLRKADGEAIWVVDTCRAVVDAGGAVVRYEGSLEDITEEKKLQDELRHMARHDPLTGVLNRYGLDEALSSEMARSRRYRHPIGVLMLDIDRFKEFNDRFGHAAGDEILRKVAGLLTRCVRETDIVVRYGGDEFLVLLVETNGEAVRVKQRIVSEMSRELGTTPYGVPIHLSIGAAHWSPETGESVDTLLSRADRAMYAEKGPAATV